MSACVEFRPTVQVVVGVIKKWIDEHNVLITSDDGESEYDFDLGGFEIEADETNYHIEESEDDLHVGDTVMVVTTRHLVVLSKK